MEAVTEKKHGLIRREIPGLFCFFLALIVMLALVSHHHNDPSLSSYSTSAGQDAVRNYIGLAGAYFSAICVDLLGLAAFWPVLLLVVLGIRFFWGRTVNHPWLVGMGIFLLLLSSAAAFSMIAPRLTSFWFQTPGGGLLGDVLVRNLIHVFNPVGAALVVAVLMLSALIMATGMSLIRLTGNLRIGLIALGSAWERKRTKVREKEARSKRLQEALSDREEREEPKIKVIPAAPPVPPEPPRPQQENFDFGDNEGEYQLPSPDLLDEPEKGKSGLSQESLIANSKLVEKKLSDFNVTGEVVEVSSGPVITMYEYRPAAGVKISKVAGLADDLAMNMRALAIRIVAPLPGKAAIGIEIPNPKREFVYLKETVSSSIFQESSSLLTLVLGVDIMGKPEVANLQKMPHLLIAGATGSGKSVGLNAIIMSILYKARPDEVRFLMIDPKRIELTPYKDLPHLIYPVVSDPSDATLALKWAVAEMENRYKLLAEKGVRNIESYNKVLKKEQAAGVQSAPPPAEPLDEDDDSVDGDAQPEPPRPLPYLVIIIDELADLMMVAAKEVESSITRLAQMARAAGIHLILATQRPSVDVLTGIIKANMPTRISFQVSSKIDSRTILDAVGAEKLLGAGDMLFLPPGTSTVRRIHGAFVSDAEIKRITDFIKAQQPPDYLEELVVPQSEGDEAGQGGDDYDEKYDEAVELVSRAGKASISLIQRHLRIGYNRAARIIEIMEREGVVGPADGARPRQVLVREL